MSDRPYVSVWDDGTLMLEWIWEGGRFGIAFDRDRPDTDSSWFDVWNGGGDSGPLQGANIPSLFERAMKRRTGTMTREPFDE